MKRLWNSKQIIQILEQRKEPDFDASKLLHHFAVFDFFQKIIKKDRNDICIKLIQNIVLEQYEAEEVVFYKNQFSDKFYLILEGQVEVFIQESGESKQICPFPKLHKFQIDNPKLFNQENKEFLLTRVSTLNRGEGFGELGVINGKARLGTVITSSKCLFGTLNINDFNTILKPLVEEEITEKLQFFDSLLNGTIFKDEMIKITAFFEKFSYNKFAVINKENSSFRFLMFISEGEIELSRLNSLKYTKNNRVEQAIIILGRYQLIGAKELYERKHYNAFSCKAKVPGHGYLIHIDNFSKLVREHPKIKNIFMNLVRNSCDEINVN